MSITNCCFLTCIQISQEAGQMVWYSHLLKNFPQFVVIHMVKGFDTVNKAEIDVFLGLSCFFFWATVSSQSCFCWLYRDSPSLAAKNIINLILVLTTWWCPCVESSLVLLEEGICYDECVLLAKTLLAFALLHVVLQGQICLLLQVSLDFLLLHSSPLWWKGHLFFFGISSRRSCRSS